MTAILRQKMIWIALAVWGSYWLWRPLFSRTHTFDVVNGIAAALSFGVVLAYGPAAWRSLKVPVSRWPSGSWLVCGVVTGCSGFLVLRTWLFWGRWIRVNVNDHPFTAWMIWIICSGYVMHIMSTGKGKTPVENLPRLFGYVLAGLMVGLVTVYILG